VKHTVHKAKLSIANKGKSRGPWPVETKTKISIASKGKPNEPVIEETKAKLSISNSKNKKQRMELLS
jgi:hypothetical protein